MGEVHSNDIETGCVAFSILLLLSAAGLDLPFLRMVIFSAELVLGPMVRLSVSKDLGGRLGDY